MICANHPERLTKRRCYQCKTGICRACTIRRDRHRFCSPACHARWLQRHAGQGRGRKRRKKRLRRARIEPAVSAIALPPPPLTLPADVRSDTKLAQAAPVRKAGKLWMVVRLAASGGLVLLAAVLLYQQQARQRALETQLTRIEKAVAAIQIEVRAQRYSYANVATESALEKRIMAFPVGAFVNTPTPTTEARLTPPSSRVEVADITRGNPERKAVSFTFDGGSEANAAEEILAVLRERGVRTTLFLTGEFVRQYPDVVRAAVADGHEIGNHTYHHPHLTSFTQNGRHDRLPGLTKEHLHKELLDTAALFTAITGRELAPYWRAPYGEVNAELRRWAEEVGFRHVGWTNVPGLGSLDSRDWVDDPQSALYWSGDDLRRHFTSLLSTKPGLIQGGIFLMHLGTARKADKIHWQLAGILDAYRRHGFEVVPVSILLQ